MQLKDLIARARGRHKSQGREVEGTIQDLRVIRVGDDNVHWMLRLDCRDDAVFWFEPTHLSPPRKPGERVRLAYRDDPEQPGRLHADWIAAA